MITEEERREIINEAVQEALLKLPEVVGNLMANHAMLSKMNSEFYKNHPEFKDNEDVVASVVEYVESENPNLEYEEILKKSVPEIKKRLETVGSIDVESVSKPSTDLGYLSLNSDNGEL